MLFRPFLITSIILLSGCLSDKNNSSDKTATPTPSPEKPTDASKPESDDKDADGMLDLWEIQYGLDTTKNGATDDKDGDFVTNIREFDLNSDPTKPDTDDDGLLDNDEILNGTDLLNADTDSDLLTDFEEVKYGFDPKSDSDGATGDADSDGLLNYQEIDNGFDPHNALSKGVVLQPLKICPSYGGMSKDGNHLAYKASRNSIRVVDLRDDSSQEASVTQDGTSSSDRVFYPVINSTGTHTAFYSQDATLFEEDTTGLVVKDLSTGELSVVGDPTNYPGSHRASFITADGKYIIYQVLHMDTPHINARVSVFRQNIIDKSIDLVSSHQSGEHSSGYNYGGSASEDGRYVIFSSRHSNLRTETETGIYAAFLKDMDTGEVKTLNRNPITDVIGDLNTYGKDITSDGRYIALVSSSSKLTDQTLEGENLYILDTQENRLRIVNKDTNDKVHSGEMGEASISQDGRFVAFSTKAEGLHPRGSQEYFNVYLKDMETGDLSLLSLSQSGASNGDCSDVVLTNDAENVFFRCSGSNLDRIYPIGTHFKKQLNPSSENQ